MSTHASKPVSSKLISTSVPPLPQTISSQQDLPPRELQLFRQALVCLFFRLILFTQKHYEGAQYKKSLKSIEMVLQSHPFHGETLCLKGSVEASLPNANKEQCLGMIKEGVKYNMKSGMSWHLMARFYRNEKNYAEAIKAFLFAAKFDKENLNVLRDLSNLQIQMRDEETNVQGFVNTRSEILKQKSAVRGNWLALASLLFLTL